MAEYTTTLHFATDINDTVQRVTVGMNEIASSTMRMEGALNSGNMGLQAFTQWRENLDSILTRYQRIQAEINRTAQRNVSQGIVPAQSHAQESATAARVTGNALQTMRATAPPEWQANPAFKAEFAQAAQRAISTIGRPAEEFSRVLRAAAQQGGLDASKTSQIVGSNSRIIQEQVSQIGKRPVEPMTTLYRGEKAPSAGSRGAMPASQATAEGLSGRYYTDTESQARKWAGEGGRVLATQVTKPELAKAQALALEKHAIDTSSAHADWSIVSPEAARASRVVPSSVAEAAQQQSLQKSQAQLQALREMAASGGGRGGGADVGRTAAAADEPAGDPFPKTRRALRVSIEEMDAELASLAAQHVKARTTHAPRLTDDPAFPYFERMAAVKNVPEHWQQVLGTADNRLLTSTMNARAGTAQDDLTAGIRAGTHEQFGGSWYNKAAYDADKKTPTFLDDKGNAVSQFKQAQLEYAHAIEQAAAEVRAAIGRSQTEGTGAYGKVGTSWRETAAGADGKNKFFSSSGHQITDTTELAGLGSQYAHQNKGFGDAFFGGMTSRGWGGGAGGGAGLDKDAISNLASTAGTLMKYSLIGQGVGMLQGVGSGMLAQVKDYTDSVTELNVALSHTASAADGAGSASAGFVNSLTEISRYSGSNPGAALDAAARGIRAFGDAAGSSATATADIGTAVAQTSSRLALLTNTDMKDATGNVIAIGQAYGLAGDQVNQVLDAVANAKNLGGDPKDISQGMASFAEVAKTAGYNVNELANLISLVVAHTDETGTVAAQKLGRVFSMVGSVGNQQFLRTMGVDPKAAPKEQVNQLAPIYQSATPALQAQIRNQFGGTTASRELIAVLDNVNKLQEANAKSAAGAGAGAEAYLRKSSDLVGMLRKLSGDIKNIQVDLARADIFAPFALGLAVLEPILHSLTKLLELYNHLPGVVKTALAALMEFKLASMTIGRLFPSEKGGISGAWGGYQAKKAAQGGIIGRAIGGSPAAVGEDAAAASTGPLLRRPKGSPGAGAYLSQVESDRLRAAQVEAAAALKGEASAAETEAAAALKTSLAQAEVAAALKASAVKAELASARFGASPLLNVTGLGSSITGLGTAAQAKAMAARDFVSERGGVGGLLGQGRAAVSEKVGNLGVLGKAMIAGMVLSVITDAWQTGKGIAKATQVANTGLATEGASAKTKEDWGQAAANLKNDAQNARSSSAGLFGTLLNWSSIALGSSAGTGAAAAKDEKQAALFTRIQQRIDDAQQKAAREAPLTSIDMTSPEGITNGLDMLQKSGADATVQIQALIASMDQMGTSAESSSRRLGAGKDVLFAQDVAGGVDTGLEGVRDAKKKQGNIGPWWQRIIPFSSPPPNAADKAYKDIKNVDFAAISDEIGASVQDYVTSTGGSLTDAQVQDLIKLEQDKLHNSPKWGKGKWKGMSKADQKAYDDAVAKQITDAVGKVFNPDDVSASFDAFIAEAIPRSQAAGGEASAVATHQGGWGALEGGKTTLDYLQRSKASAEAAAQREGKAITPDELKSWDDAITAAENTIAEQEIARVDALGKLTEAKVSPFDKLGRIQVQLSTIREELTHPMDAAKRAGLEAEQQAQQDAADAQMVADAAAQRSAGVDSRDAPGVAKVAVTNAQAALDAITARGTTSGADYENARKALADAEVASMNADVTEANTFREAKVAIGDSVGEANAKYFGLLDVAKTQIGAAKEATLRQAAQAAQDSIMAQVTVANANDAADVALGDLVGDAQTKAHASAFIAANAVGDAVKPAVKQAAVDAQAAIVAVVDRANALAESVVAVGDTIGDATEKYQSAMRTANATVGEDQRAKAFKQAAVDYQALVMAGVSLSNAQVDSAVDPRSGLDKARAAVATATATLNGIREEPGYLKDPAYWQALGALRQAQVAAAQAELDNANNVRLLGQDSTNPLQMAQAATAAAAAKWNLDARTGAPADVMNTDTLDLRHAKSAEQGAGFSQWMTDLQNQDKLHDISHTQMLRSLQGRSAMIAAEMAGMSTTSEGYRQLLDQQTAVRQAILDYNNTLQGQFNLGDIKIPTPYEVRRSLATDAVGQPYDTHTTTQTSVSIQINGADILQVKALLDSYLVSGIGGRTTVPRKV